jgi:CO dehydrogenase maturation factor
MNDRPAATWANRATGQDLTAQIDPDFVIGPQALTARQPAPIG